MFSTTESVALLQKKVTNLPECLMILGTGWNKVLDQAEIEAEIAYSELFGIAAGVPGHVGKLIVAKLGEERVVCMAGRFHTYEGYTSEEVTRPIQVLAQLGIKQMIVTAAVGAINEAYRVGDFVILRDMITLLCPSPLVGAKFVDLSQVFDPELSQKASQICAAQGFRAHEGVYAFCHGPNFETPADKMMLHHLGADVVGMSTVPETIMARSLEVKVLGLSFVTNLAFVKHEHSDVLAAAQKSGAQMATLLSQIVGRV